MVLHLQVRVCEERSDELRRRFCGILKCNADTSGCYITVANSTAVSNVTNINSFATR